VAYTTVVQFRCPDEYIAVVTSIHQTLESPYAYDDCRPRIQWRGAEDQWWYPDKPEVTPVRIVLIKNTTIMLEVENEGLVDHYCTAEIVGYTWPQMGEGAGQRGLRVKIGLRGDQTPFRPSPYRRETALGDIEQSPEDTSWRGIIKFFPHLEKLIKDGPVTALVLRKLLLDVIELGLLPAQQIVPTFAKPFKVTQRRVRLPGVPIGTATGVETGAETGAETGETGEETGEEPEPPHDPT